MAALKDNLRCPWYVNQTRDSLDRFQREGGEGLRKSEDRRVELQGDFLNLQRDKHLRRAMALQRRWEELTEREGRARRRNQQLLQDLQRAQVTLEEMVSHTATMNTIRLEYKRYLEENYPRWHQQLYDHTRAAHKKRTEELLKDFLKRREEEQETASFIKEHFCPPREHTDWPQRANGRPDGSVPPTRPPLPLILAHSTTVFPQPPPSPVSHQTSPQQGPPPTRASGAVGWPTGFCAPWAPGTSGWGLGPSSGAEVMGGAAPGAEGRGQNRTPGGKWSSEEADIKSVGLSSSHGDSSAGSSGFGGGQNQGDRRKRREEGRQPSGSDSKRGSQGSVAGHWSADPEVVPTPTAVPLTRGRRATEQAQDSSSASGAASHSTRSRGPKSAPEQREEGRESDLDPSRSPQETSCRSLRVKPLSPAEESSGEDPTESSEGSAEERGRRKDPESVRLRSQRGMTGAGERAGEKAADSEADHGEHIHENCSSEEEEHPLMEEGEDEEESQREEEEEELEDEREASDEGQESDASGQEEGREQTGSSESESAAMSQAEEEQEVKDLQAKIKDGVEAEVKRELDEDESGSEEGVGIVQPQAGESEEETDSDDRIISPQKHRYLKEGQGVSEEEEEVLGESDGGEEGEDGESSVGSPESDDEEEGADIERLVAPQVETQSKQRENEPESLGKTKVVKKDSWVEESSSEDSDRQVKMKAEDTDDEFDHFYD